MANFFNEHAAEIFALINLVLGTLILPLLYKWLSEHLTKSQAARAEIAIQSGINVAIQAFSKGKNSADTIREVLNTPDVRDNVVGMASEYVRNTIPKTVGKLGIDPELEAVVNARVDEVVAKLAERYMTANKAIVAADKIATEAGVTPV